MKKEKKEVDIYVKNDDGSVSVKRVMATVITINQEDTDSGTDEELRKLIKSSFF